MKKIITLTCIVLFVGTIEGFTQRCLPKQWGFELNCGWGDGYPLLKKRNLQYKKLFKQLKLLFLRGIIYTMCRGSQGNAFAVFYSFGRRIKQRKENR